VVVAGTLCHAGNVVIAVLVREVPVSASQGVHERIGVMATGFLAVISQGKAEAETLDGL
jgi:hypothetical protein